MVNAIILFIQSTTRPAISYALTATLIYCVVTGLVDPKEIVTPTAMILAFWFGTRSPALPPNDPPSS